MAVIVRNGRIERVCAVNEVPEEMDRVAEKVLDMIWSRKKEFLMEYPTIWDFLMHAVDYAKPVLLVYNGTIKIIVCEFSTFFHDPELLRNMGIVPEREDVIVQKTHKLYLPAYRDIQKSIAIADTRGVTDRNFKELAFTKIRRPVWPLDDFRDAPLPGDADSDKI